MDKEGIVMGEKIKVGIVGCGFVGGALKTWIEENNTHDLPFSLVQ